MNQRDLGKAALRGEPSYIWRAGQERRLDMIRNAAGIRMQGCILDNGCGVGTYVQHLGGDGGQVFGLEYDQERARQAHRHSEYIVSAAGENLPFSDEVFDLILSHEVLEHVQDDRAAAREMVRVLAPGGRLVIFVPNQGYPFETHGIYWRGRYRFGNIPLVNYLPRPLRDYLAPHVRVYNRRDLNNLFGDLPVRPVHRAVIFGAYDNIIARYPGPGNLLRRLLYALEHTPFQVFGLSHFWVLEKL